MSSALIRSIETRLKYLNMVMGIQKIEPSSDKYLPMLMQACTDVMKACIGAKTISFDDAIAIQLLVRDSKLTEDMVRQITSGIDSRITGEVVGNDSGKQNLQCFDMYLSEVAQTTFNGDEHPDRKLYVAGRHLINLRAIRLNEKSWSHCLSVALHKDLPVISGDERIAFLQKLKGYVREATPSEYATIHGPKDYPSDIDKFVAENPDIATLAFHPGQRPMASN